MAGLEELICRSETEYVAAAINMAADAEKRGRVRSALLALAKQSPPVYFETAVFSRRVGDALANIYERYCQRYEHLAHLGPTDRTQALQALADTVAGQNFELNGLTDIGIVTALIEPFFQALPQSAPRHMIDVGACYGAMSLPLLERGWTADLFEPDPDARAVLMRNTANCGTRCRVHATAVSHTSAPEVTFHKSATNGCSGLDASPFAPTQSVIKVPCVSLAKFCAERRIDAIDFLKIDAEGFDFDVLESHDFGILQPRLVLVEYGTHFARQTLEVVNAAIERMTSRGYGAIVFNYTAVGDFKQGEWIYKLTEIFVEAAIPELGRAAFGNILFYRQDDTDFLLTVFALLDSCRRPTEVWQGGVERASGA
jgi:FkbM family methyltransferase